MSIPTRLYHLLKNRIRIREYERAHAKFSSYTMLTRARYVANLKLIAKCGIADVPGCVVECGVWRGGMIAGIADCLGEDRTYYLFDSFEGLPPVQEIDGEKAKKWQSDTTAEGYHDNCTAPKDIAAKAMSLSASKDHHLVQGWFNETVPTFHPEKPIALLRLDGDWYESTMVCLDSLFDKMAEGGMIIIDDYYDWDGCSRAVHDFLSKRKAAEKIHSFEGVCYLLKKA